MIFQFSSEKKSQNTSVVGNIEMSVLMFFREQDMRNSILAQVLDQSARARCKCFYSKSLFKISVNPHLK